MMETAFYLLTFSIGVGVGAFFMNMLMFGRFGDGFEQGYARGKTDGRSEGLNERRTGSRATFRLPSGETARG